MSKTPCRKSRKIQPGSTSGSDQSENLTNWPKIYLSTKFASNLSIILLRYPANKRQTYRLQYFCNFVCGGNKYLPVPSSRKSVHLETKMSARRICKQRVLTVCYKLNLYKHNKQDKHKTQPTKSNIQQNQNNALL